MLDEATVLKDLVYIQKSRLDIVSDINTGRAVLVHDELGMVGASG
jgi:hypothetical protein